MPQDFSITLLWKSITPSKSAKSLRITLNASLTFNEHITEVVPNVQEVCQINRVKHLLDKSTLVSVLNALVFSKPFYPSSVLANTKKRNIARVQVVQNFAAQIVSGVRKYDHITPYLKQLYWLPVAQLLEIRDIVMTFKCVKGLAPPQLSARFKKRDVVH